jgi:hypothetical protein
VASSNETKVFAPSLIRDGIARFVSRLRGSWAWYDIHLPLTPQPVRAERSSLPGQRSNTAAHWGGRR